ncbi:larval cuticle protein 1-like [Pieris brassicae]|uniref:larval cuticle protein 1-like n=1 Tax=Pieris brassicae TaxID=7116 RepID=UPI001E661E86|nr:larval cuticle protein 1-like [Pieris brassicae]
MYLGEMYKRFCSNRFGISRSSATKPNQLTMKLIIVALAFVAVATAAVVPVANEPTKILRSEYEHKSDGGYIFNYESEDGSSRSEVGEPKEVLDEENKPHQVVVVRGSFSYVDSEGKTETINYYADESGFHAEGDSVPKPVSRK